MKYDEKVKEYNKNHMINISDAIQLASFSPSSFIIPEEDSIQKDMQYYEYYEIIYKLTFENKMVWELDDSNENNDKTSFFLRNDDHQCVSYFLSIDISKPKSYFGKHRYNSAIKLQKLILDKMPEWDKEWKE